MPMPLPWEEGLILHYAFVSFVLLFLPVAPLRVPHCHTPHLVGYGLVCPVFMPNMVIFIYIYSTGILPLLHRPYGR